MSNINVNIISAGNITVSINGAAPIAKTVKPVITSVGGGDLRFVCDGIDEVIQSTEALTVDGQELAAQFIIKKTFADAVYFKILMDETFTGGVGPAPGYLVYTAILQQNASAAPVAIVMQNTLGGTVVWSRSDVGVYAGTLAGAFPQEAKTWVIVGSSSGLAQGGHSDANSVFIETFLPSYVPSDSVIANTAIEIRVYP